MLKNYIKIAWRNILKNRFYSLVNIIGLATGIAFTLLIAAYVWGELQVNKNLKNAENHYILQSKWLDPNMGYQLCTIAALPRSLKDNYPNLVANYYRWDGVSSNVSQGDKHFREGITIGDSTVLTMYGFKLLSGDSRTALNDPFAVVITQNIALKYFGKTDVVGKTITIESFNGSKHAFTINGVMEKPAKNSVTNINDGNKAEIYLPAEAAKFMGRNLDGWGNTAIAGYLELKPGVKPADLDGPMRLLINKNAPDQVKRNLKPYLVPLSEYYLNSDGQTAKKMIYTLSFISLFILLMAVINFVNMCVSRSSTRMKEMGIRKVLGGLRKQLIGQFLTESVIIVLLSTFFAVGFYLLARPAFSAALGKQIPGLLAFPAYFLLYPVLLALFIGLLAGIYPAFVLTALKSVDSLKGKAAAVRESVWLRKSLVAFQFGIAAVVFISALVISQQINLFFSKNLGFDKEYVVYAAVPRDWSRKGVQKMETIRYQMAQLPQVSSATLSWEVLDGRNGGGFVAYRPGSDVSKGITAQKLVTDNQYAATYHLSMKAGTFFTPQYAPGDSAKVVINETQAKALGWKEPSAAIGQQFIADGFGYPMTVCGVVADFYFGSMRGRIPPITFTNVNQDPLYRYLSFKIKAGNIEESVAALQAQWSTLMPDAPFEYHFMDEALFTVYATEVQLKKAAYIATTLAIVIVLLGVLGLISQSVQKRSKEISIRKVLGSSVTGIIALFLREFMMIILIAGLIACPLAYILMQKWLSDYAYRIDINFNPFVITIGLLGLFTTLLIAMQTIKAALRSPAKSLRSE